MQPNWSFYFIHFYSFHGVLKSSVRKYFTVFASPSVDRHLVSVLRSAAVVIVSVTVKLVCSRLHIRESQGVELSDRRAQASLISPEVDRLLYEGVVSAYTPTSYV